MSCARVKPRVVAIVGPTGSGKTDLALRLARVFNGELIAADSRTVYRGMDVGTAKPKRDTPPVPTPEGGGEKVFSPLPPRGGGVRGGGTYSVEGVPHHLLDIRNPNQSYSVAEFQADAERLIREITNRGKLSIVVGGTGLYISALVNNFVIPAFPAQPKLRESFERKSVAELLTLLERFDPDVVQTIDRKNPRRIIRALEVCIFAGQPFSALRKAGESPFEFLQLGIQRTRPALYRRIDRGIRVMFQQGLMAEVGRLLGQYGPNVEPLRGIIYRQAVEYLIQREDLHEIYGRRNRGGLGMRESKNAALRELMRSVMFANHRYARHQLMWFKRDKRIHWVRTPQQAERLVRKFL